MGYRRNKKVYNLKFADPEMAGLAVSMKSLSTEGFLRISSLAAGSSKDGGSESVRQLLTGFSESIIGWNLEDEDGQPVPTTYEGVASQEFDFIIQIVASWISAIAGVDTPLKRDSGNGKVERELDLASMSRPN